MRILDELSALAHQPASFPELVEATVSRLLASGHVVAAVVHLEGEALRPAPSAEGGCSLPLMWAGRCLGRLEVELARSSPTALELDLLHEVARILSGARARALGSALLGSATRLLAEPLGSERGIHSVAPPLHVSSTYAFESMEQAAAFHAHPDAGYTYTRWGNPTIRATEQAVALAEGAPACVLLGSGMAAIATTLLALCEAGDVICAPHNLYGGTHHLLVDLLPRYGIRTCFVEVEALAATAAGGGFRLVYFEPVTNPTLRVLDVAAIVAAARSGSSPPLVVVDNTLATPQSLRPLDVGADLVIHSATKYLGGHSDLLAGAVCGEPPLVERVRRSSRLLGGGFNPREAWLLARGLKTLGVRFARQAATAAALARWLEARPEVRRAWHPTLVSHPEHALAKRQLRQGCAMVTIELHTASAAWRLLDNLTLWRRAVSLGGVESLVSLPVLSSHHGVDAASLARAGVTEATVRLSVGLEDLEDLQRDLEHAFACVAEHGGAAEGRYGPPPQAGL